MGKQPGDQQARKAGAAAGRPAGLAPLLQLVREEQAGLAADLDEVAAARRAASASLDVLPKIDSERRHALCRLLRALEASEDAIRLKLAEKTAQADRLAVLAARCKEA